MKRTLLPQRLFAIILLTSILWLPVGTDSLRQTDQNSPGALSDEETATLSSLAKIDDYPLYTMHYYGTYKQAASSMKDPAAPMSLARSTSGEAPVQRAWACTLFAALADTKNRLYGRNFDWEYSPALLLFTQPPDGYASAEQGHAPCSIYPSRNDGHS